MAPIVAPAAERATRVDVAGPTMPPRPVPYAGAVLADGSYDALVFDAEEAAGGGITVELTIVAGDHKGEVVSLHAADWSDDPIELLGVPATITVADGAPSVRFEP